MLENCTVHYLSQADNPIKRRKNVFPITYDNYTIYVLDEDKYDYPNVLYRDQNDEYWMMYHGSIEYKNIEHLINNDCNEYDKERYINYWNFVSEKIKFIYGDISSYFHNRIEANMYFNKIELEFIKTNYPDMYELALESRSICLKNRETERSLEAQKQLEETNKKIREKNDKFKEQIKTLKQSILEGKNVLSSELNYYRNDNYYDEVYQNNFLYLFQQYNIDVPLATKGYINNKLYSYDFGTGGYKHYGNYSSQVIRDYMDKLKRSVELEKENSIKDMEEYEEDLER